MKAEKHYSGSRDGAENSLAPEVTQVPVDPRVAQVFYEGVMSTMGANGSERDDTKRLVADFESGAPPEEVIHKIGRVASSKQGNSVNSDDPNSSSYLV